MTNQISRHRLPLCLALCLVAGCPSNTTPDDGDDDPCAHKPVVPGGSVELGRGVGAAFMPLVDGQDLTLEIGTQTFLMFVLTARVHDMEVGSGGEQGIVDFAAFDQTGAQVSTDFGCRLKEFVPSTAAGSVDGAAMVFASPFGLALPPDYASHTQLEGARMTLQVEVRDRAGRQAIDRRTVVAHRP
jgi:hypothetical protein